MSIKMNTLQEKHLDSKKLFLSFLLGMLVASAVCWLLAEQAVYSVSDLQHKSNQAQLDKSKNVEYLNLETSYSKLTNTELKQLAAQKKEMLLKVYQEYKNFDSLTHYSKKLSWNDRLEIYNKQSIFGGQMIQNYEIHNKVEVVLLREQILLRLPEEYAKRSAIHHYQYPTNPIGFKSMLDDFCKLVYSLAS